jgi:DNA-binding NtrC family response regulator
LAPRGVSAAPSSDGRSQPPRDEALPAPSPPGWAPPSDPRSSTKPAPIDLDSQLDDIERRELLAALERCGGNKAEVARSLGVQRTTLYYRLKRLGIDI